MTERLFQFIWQHRYFNTSDLKTVAGEELQIINPGMHNTSQGPDFLNAQIKCGKTILAGSIELHINASEWLQHGHSNDRNYQNCILHVVWKNDRDLQLAFPVLELHDRVSNMLIDKYESMMGSPQFIACEEHLHKVNDITLRSWKERLFIERMQQRTSGIKSILEENHQHWEEVFWQMLAANFGMKINTDAFSKLAQSLPTRLLAKHRHQLLHIEALLLGQANLLNANFEDDYPKMLQREYRFLQKKYSLQPIHIPVLFLRMRPANFPTIRLAQLAALVCGRTQLFTLIKETDHIKDVMKMFDVTANDYWHYHYTFNDESAFKQKHLGKQMTENIMLNTIVPLLYAYGRYHHAEAFQEKALRWAGELSPENNYIMKGFQKIGIKNENALDSQALIQLKNNYCGEKRCLQCAIGNKILKTE